MQQKHTLWSQGSADFISNILGGAKTGRDNAIAFVIKQKNKKKQTNKKQPSKPDKRTPTKLFSPWCVIQLGLLKKKLDILH